MESIALERRIIVQLLLNFFTFKIRMVNNEAEFKKLGPKEPPPFGLKIFKGYKNVILRRDMVNFFINHPISKTFLQYVQDIKIPDEHFYATLVRIENVVLTNM